jgi:hypothetical protein
VGNFERETSDSDRREDHPRNDEQRPSHVASIGAESNGLNTRASAPAASPDAERQPEPFAAPAIVWCMPPASRTCASS